MISIVAILCSLASPQDCHNEVVITADFGEISMTSCMMGAPQLAEWMKDHPNERLAGWRCFFGKRVQGI
jgi:hypothetical protein